MFDLDMKSVVGLDQEQASCGLLYRHDETREQLEEAVRFYGMGQLQSSYYDGEAVDDTIAGVRYPLLFIEVGDALLDEVERWRYLLSHDLQVILIGRENSILTMRQVEQLGFYYLLWPAEKDLIGWTLNVLREDQQQSRGPHHVRTAMRTAVVGLKGGCGCTMIASELAHVIAARTDKQVILVDHNYHTTGHQSGMAVMLGRQSLERQRLGSPGAGHNALARVLDQISAQSQLFRLDPLISYLGIEGDRGNGEELREYNNQLLQSLAREANFVIEDYSASVDFSLNPEWLCQLMNCVIVVVDSTLTSLVQTRPFLEQLQQINDAQTHPSRILLVLNHTRPGTVLDRRAVEEYLSFKVTIEMPWVKDCEDRLVNHQRFHNTRSPLTYPFRNLGSAILGKSMVNPTLFERLKVLWPW